MPGVVPSAQGLSPGGRPPYPPVRGGRAIARTCRWTGAGGPRPGSRSPAEPAGGRPGRRRRAPGEAAEAAPFTVGQDVEVTIEDVAQGGWCVARPDGLPVMFVRHALPGERVVARVTEVTSKFARADAVEILAGVPGPGGRAVPARPPGRLRRLRLAARVPPRPARPQGGGDHPATAAPRRHRPRGHGRAASRRRGEIPWTQRPARRALAGAPASSSRSTATAWPGLRGHRSHRVIDIGDCLIAHQAVRDLDIPGDDWSGATAVEVAVGGADSTENFAVTVIEDAGRQQR